MIATLKNLAPPINGARVRIVRRNVVGQSVRVRFLEPRGECYKTGDEITVQCCEVERDHNR